MVANRLTKVEQLQNIENIFKILKEPFLQYHILHEDNLSTSKPDKQKIVNDLYIKFNELSGDRKVEFYNDFIKKCWHYFLLQQQEIKKNPESNQAKLNKNNLDAQLQILHEFKNFLITKEILPESSNSISPSSNSIDSLLISWKPIARTLITFNASIEKSTNSSLRRTTGNSINSAYLDSQSKIIKHLDEMKSDSNPKDDLFFREYLLKHIELVNLYRQQNIYLESNYGEKFNKYVIRARRNCLNNLLSMVNFSFLQDNEINFGKILPSKEINRYLYELRVLKYCLQNPSYNSKSKDKLDHFLTLEINRFSNKKITKVSTNSPSKPFASILRRGDGIDKTQGNKGVKFSIPQDVTPRERLPGWDKRVESMRMLGTKGSGSKSR